MQSTATSCPRRSAGLCLTLLFGTTITTTVQAQGLRVTGPVQPGVAEPGISIKWWHGAITVGGVSALLLLDNPVRGFSQGRRGAAGDGVASVVRRMGQPEVYATVSLGLLGAGLVSGDPRLTRSGARAASALALTSAVVYGGKYLLGRGRPDDLLKDEPAMPSGHTAMAFALATSLADDIDRPWATVGLYTMAGAVGWSRINDNRHWLSDVAAGAVLGIASAKFALGKWTIFGLRAPSIITGPRGVGVGWQAEF
jgi:membrane-associated phospholipid phosphatase